MNTFSRLFLFSLTLALLNPACTGDDANTGPTCSPGSTQFCVCTDGSMGQQGCGDDGSTWLPCQCGSTPVTDATGPTDTANATDTASTPDTTTAPDVTLPPPIDTGATTPPAGNNQCNTDDDCAAAGKCPADAEMGCKCVANQQGVKRCLAICETSADCPIPKKQDIVLGCNPQGVCTKKAGQQQGNAGDNAGGNAGGNNNAVLSNCTSQSDCEAAGGCPTDAPKGCSCITTNNGGQKCVPLCDQDKDCPASLTVDMICGEQQGHCVPENGNAGQDPGMDT